MQPLQALLALEAPGLRVKIKAAMFKHLGHHTDEMVLAFVVWLCTLPLVGLIVIPVFGLKAAGAVALILLIAAVITCWGICSWKISKG